MRTPNRHNGFVLIELVMTLILVGIIGVFTSFFIYTGVTGFLNSKKISETALRAQIAMDRISSELRHITSVTGEPVGKLPGTILKSITYTCADLPFERIIRYDKDKDLSKSIYNIYLSVNGIENILLDNVATFSLTLTSANQDNLSAPSENEISSIKLGFTVADVGTPFSVQIYPRSLIPYP
jgi:prepilin-type N-terminal cleavage/methylation domain-containing protein